jgi:hypothetical protein
VKRERGVKVRRVQGGKQQEGRMEGKESGKQSGEERLSSRGREGWREGQGWELVKERVISSVSLEGKSAAEDTFANSLKDSGGDLLDRLPKPFRR